MNCRVHFFTLLTALLSTIQLFGFGSCGNCTVGDLISSSSTEYDAPQGTIVLDIGNPAPCTGMITAWHFCHYAPDISSASASSRTYSAQFQIWRRTVIPTVYERITDSVVSEILTRNNPGFFCVERELLEEEYVPIEEGYILAAFMPGLNGLRLISEDMSGGRLLSDQTGADVGAFTMASESSGVVLSSHELHLSATIEFEDEETTMLPMVETTTAAVDGNSTGVDGNSTGMGGPADNNSGAVAAGVVIVLLLLIAGAAALVVGLLLWYYKGRRRFEGLKRPTTSSYDNAVYDEAPVRSNSALAAYLNSTIGENPKPSTEYEIPIKSKTELAPPNGNSPAARGKPESMYVSMDGASFQKSTDMPDFVESAETAQNNERYSVHKRNRKVTGRDTSSVFDIYRSFGPDNEIYCQFMEETASLPHGSTVDFDPYADPPSSEEEILKALAANTRNIHFNELVIHEEIGSGEFAYVNKAEWSEANGRSLTVAVKTLHTAASNDERLKLLQEAVIMSQFVHPNVVRLIGVVSAGGDVSLVTEFCARGDLHVSLNELRRNKALPQNMKKNLLSYSQQVALAMHYLSSKGFIHRDLAARNIFVTQENICKVGDFGMSRDLANAEYYLSQGGAIPVRWTAPEAVYYSKYSTASDVWSYGCLLFEIWSVGWKPFEGLPNTEVLETIRNGYRLPPPPGTPLVLYQIMINCWHPEKNSRPQFQSILESMLREESDLLLIPAADGSSHLQARQLGAPLEAGKGMYLSLQHSYLKSTPANKRETIYEAIDNYRPSSPPSKPLLTQQSSFSSGNQPPLPPTPTASSPLTPKRMGKPPLTPKPMVTPPLTPKPLLATPPPGKKGKPPIAPKPSGLSPDHKATPRAEKEDDIYDDIMIPEDIYEDTVIPASSIYDTPIDAVENNYEVPDYEHI